MGQETAPNGRREKLTLVTLSTPLKVWVTCLLATLAIGMLGAAGQIIVHDIVPTLYSTAESKGHSPDEEMVSSAPSAYEGERGDLFADLEIGKAREAKPFYEDEQFVWTLKWSHIHLFGMNLIFIFLGAVTALLDASVRLRIWLIVLPFVGVLVDISAEWLKGFVSPAFFWLHVPGGGLFGAIFIYVFLRALLEMWLKPTRGINSAGSDFF